MKKYLTSIFCVLSLCLCFSTHAIAASTPENIAVDFTKKMYSGDVAGVIQLFNMENYDQATKAVVIQVLSTTAISSKQKADMLGGVRTVTVTSMNYDSTNGRNSAEASVNIRTIFGSGSMKEHHFILIKTQKTGQWKVLTAKS